MTNAIKTKKMKRRNRRKMRSVSGPEMAIQNKRKSINYLCLFRCSLKSLAKWLNLLAKCLWSDFKCFWSDTKVANIKPIVKIAPKLKTNKETIMSSTDQEPEKSNLIIWYTTKMPNRIRRMTATLSMAIILSFFILTTNQSCNQPNNKNNDYNNNNSKQPIKVCPFHYRLAKTLSYYINFSLKINIIDDVRITRRHSQSVTRNAQHYSVPRAHSWSGASNHLGWCQEHTVTEHPQDYSAYHYARTAEEIRQDYNKGLARLGIGVEEG